MLKSIDFKIKGVVPLMMHNGQLADPLNPYVKRMREITDKPAKKKTDADHQALADLEWEGSLYLDEERRVVVPGEVIEGALTKAAKRMRSGDQIKTGVICDGNWPLEYDGPKSLDKLRADPRFRDRRNARVNSGRVMRTRPIFTTWSLSFTLNYDPDYINKDQVIRFLATSYIGDYIPKYGRFVVVSPKINGQV